VFGDIYPKYYMIYYIYKNYIPLIPINDIYTSMFDCQRLSHLANFSECPGSIPSSMSVGLNLDVPKNHGKMLTSPWKTHGKTIGNW